MNKSNNISSAIAVALVALAVLVWRQVFFAGPPKEPQLIFFDVGQGDATMLILPGGVKILTDAGPDGKIAGEMRESGIGKYIDLAIISHPQLDHFNGFNYLLDNYDFGAFIFNGRSGESGEWVALMNKISAKKIPLITLGAGDRVLYGGNTITILSPDNILAQSAELNDTSIVEFVESPPFKAILTGDIGFSAENYLISKNYSITADVLKVAHHGSKNSSGDKFLEAVSPKVAVIQSGVKNRYGHPSREALARIGAVADKILRTDLNGTITVKTAGNKLLVFTER